MQYFSVFRNGESGFAVVGGLTHESVEPFHRRNGLEDGLFEKVSASSPLLKRGLCAVLDGEVWQ
jgi:hypothetical protein